MGGKTLSGGTDQKDHGEVIRGRGRQVSLTWLFPLLALAAGVWMFGTHWLSRGPEIEIRFADAPGIQAGKTSLIYRGVKAGEVTRVHLDSSLEEALVTVRLEKFAAGLAVEGTDFWIDQPVLSLQEMTGLTSLIQGNSIHARMGSGPKMTKFTGLSRSPVLPLDKPSVRVRLVSEETQPLGRGAPVTYRGVLVGSVCEQGLTPEGQPFVDLDVDKKHASLLKTSSRFWVVPATALNVGPGGVSLDFAGLDSLLQGAVAFDDFGVRGEVLTPGATVPVLASEALARACAEPFTITFTHGRGLREGQSRLKYLGLPVGMVTGVRAANGRVEVTAQFEPGYDHLRRAGAMFTLIEPSISLRGVSGLETLITGVFIDCEPGSGVAQTSFTGVLPEDPQLKIEESRAGLQLKLVCDSTNISIGAPVLFREMQVGMVEGKDIGRDGRSVELTIGIEQRYAPLVRQNSVFWDEGALRGSIGFLNIRIQSAPLISSLGSVAFATPDASAPMAKPGARFTLNAKPKKDWLRWDPAIPLPDAPR